ncbi:MAG: DUF4115 domain-containing protein [Elusimicrobia bacterium]|nr:DUF4115 domain-containing protein [Elusimicrobiota bacterium]
MNDLYGGSEALRKIPTTHVPETKADIGSTLKATRLKKGITLEAVTQHTRIPKRFLEAIEANRLDEIPALAYLRGFMKSYCDYLEVDFEPLWKEVMPERVEEKTAAPAAPPPPAAPQPSSLPLPTAILAGLVVTAALALIAIALRSRKDPRADTSHSPAAVSAPQALAPVRSAAEPNLVIEFQEDAWISLKADGSRLFEGRVPKGSRQEWRAKKVLTLLTPTPERLKLMLNGVPYNLPPADLTGHYHIETP